MKPDQPNAKNPAYASETDYASVAEQFDHRYRNFRYQGITDSLRRFLGSDPCVVLEVGCGTGHWLGVMESLGHRVTGLDPSRAMLRQARAKRIGAPMIEADAMALPFGASTFDRIVCVHTLHHFSDTAAFFADAIRLLKPGGALVTFDLDPFDPENVWYVYQYFEPTLELDRQRYPSRERIRREMSAAGFEAVEPFEADIFKGELEAERAFERGMTEKFFTSQLTVLSDAAHTAGVTAIREAMRRAAPQPLMLETQIRDYGTMGWRPG